MKNEIPTWAIFPMIFGAVVMMLVAIVMIMLAGPIAYDILGGTGPKWKFYLVAMGSVTCGFGAGTLSVILFKELFS